MGPVGIVGTEGVGGCVAGGITGVGEGFDTGIFEWTGGDDGMELVGCTTGAVPCGCNTGGTMGLGVTIGCLVKTTGERIGAAVAGFLVGEGIL